MCLFPSLFTIAPFLIPVFHCYLSIFPHAHFACMFTLSAIFELNKSCLHVSLFDFSVEEVVTKRGRPIG